MNKIKTLLTIVMALFAMQVFAQPDDVMDEKRKDKIDALKRMYINDKLELSVAEAEKFWPVYNEYESGKEQIKQALRQSQKKMKEGNHTEKEVQQSIDLMTQKRKEEADWDAKFLKDCLPILGPDKVVRLAGLQKEFQKELINKMKEKRQERLQNGQAPGRRRF